MQREYAVILGNLGQTCDRFLSSGYKDQPSKEEMLRQAASIPGVTGIELIGDWDVTPENADHMKGLLADLNVRCACVIPDHFSRKMWGNGAFTSRDPAIRKRAVEETKVVMDVAATLECDLVNLWPGQDGYDYPFQGDFQRAHDWLVEGVRECADYRQDIRLALEYKLKEPRTHSYIARAADTLLLAKDIDRPTVGVTIDVGHAMMAYEDVAESAAMLARAGRLFHMHFNDNYRAWDDDMIVGSVHTVEYLELLYWLRKLDYTGWYSMDQYPYREDAREALAESLAWLAALERCIDAYGMDGIAGLVERGSATETTREIRKMMAGLKDG